MSLKNKIISRFKYEFIGQIVSVMSLGILTVLLARLLSSEGYGLLFLSISIFGVFKIFSRLGISNSAAKYITTYNSNSPKQVPHILRFTIILNLIVLLIVSILIYYFSPDLASLMSEDELEPFIRIGILFVIASTLMTYTRFTLKGFESIEQAAIINVISRVSRLIFATGLVLVGFGAIGALIGYILSYSLAAIFGFFFLFKYNSSLRVDGRMEEGLRKRIVEYSIPLTATQTANALDRYVDTLLIGFFLTPVHVAYYTVSKQIVQFIETPVTSLGFTISPTFESQKSKGNIQTSSMIYENSLRYGLLLYVPAGAGIFLLSEPLVMLLFGDEYSGAVPILKLLSVYIVLLSITRLTSSGLDFLGRARERAIIKMATAVMNVVLNILLIPIYGVIGAAYSTVFTFGIYTFFNVYIMYAELSFNVVSVAHTFLNTLAITLFMSMIVYTLGLYFFGPLYLVLAVPTGVGVWLILSIYTSEIDLPKIINLLKSE